MKIQSNIYSKLCLLIGLICLTTMVKAQEKKILGFKETRLSMSAEYGSDKSGFETDDPNAKNKYSQNTNLMLTLEGVFSKKRKSDISVLFGIGYSWLCFKRSYNTPLYSVTTDEDIDGDTYIRQYHNVNMYQEPKGGALVLSLAIRERLKLGKSLNVYGDLGMNGLITATLDLRRHDGSAYIDGLYSQYDNLVLDENWGNGKNYNGFGDYYFCNSKDVKLEQNRFVPIAFARIGIELELTKKCNLFFGTVYHKYLRNLVDYKETNEKITPDNALMFNTINEQEISKENVRSILSTYKKSKRDGFMLNAGLSVKF